MEICIKTNKTTIKYSFLIYIIIIMIDDECPICFDQIDGNQTCRLDTCMHTFCETCITRWSTQGCTSCPYCRKLYNTITLSDNTVKYVTSYAWIEHVMSQRQLYRFYKKYPYRVCNIKLYMCINLTMNTVPYISLRYVFIPKWQLYQSDMTSRLLYNKH